MGNNTKFQRLFLIFKQEDAGYGVGQEPSGYIRIEIREGKGKLISLIQNLKEQQEGYCYKMYIIKQQESGVIPVCAGIIPILKNKGEIKWEFDPVNVAMTGYSIDKFKVAAVLVENKNGENTGVICPLAAYRDKKTEWRHLLKAALYKPAANKEKKVDTLRAFEIDEIMMEAYTDDGNIAELKDIDNDINQLEVCPGIFDQDANNREDEEECISSNPSPLDDGYPNMQLEGLFNKYFEKYDPFNSKRRDYRWWKVNSPVYLNNILYLCNIKTPLLFNPVAMMSHFKYRYLLVGIYSDKVRGREYIVCGIPGAFNVDDKPFGDMCKWVQLEGNKPKYGAFGYWLVYIDPKTGKMLTQN